MNETSDITISRGISQNDSIRIKHISTVGTNGAGSKGCFYSIKITSLDVTTMSEAGSKGVFVINRSRKGI